jgi:hypothetical protein
VSGVIQAALMNTLRVPPEDFYQLIFKFPKKRFLQYRGLISLSSCQILRASSGRPLPLTLEPARQQDFRKRHSKAEGRIKGH